MNSGLYAACAGLLARTQALEVAANNLANVNTSGYKAQLPSFHSLLATANENVGSDELSQAVNNFGVLGESRTNLAQGSLEHTGSDLDFAIQGEGWFAVQSGAGRLYTRNGNFHVDRSGRLATADGDPVAGAEGPILIPPGKLSVSNDGTISVDGALAGQLQIVNFTPGTTVTAVGGANFSAPAGSERASAGSIVQGSLEGSNVNGVTAAVELVALQRHADMLQQALTSFHSNFNRIAAQDFVAHLRISMFRALYTAATGMVAQQLNLDNVANNLSNASTSGFRRRRLQFQDLIYQNLVMPGSAATQNTTVASGLQIGLGTKTAASEVIQAQGDFNSTGNPLDLAIQGTGFFQVKMPNGETGYTRAGMFHLDNQGNMVTADGDPLDPPITIPADALSVSIGSDGTVSVTQPGQTQASQVGSIQLATFQNPGGLNSVGQNVYLATTASGDPIVGTPGGSEGLGTLQQGVLEQSNVNVVEEFIQMILAQRSYEANSRVVTAADQMLQQLNNLSR